MIWKAWRLLDRFFSCCDAVMLANDSLKYVPPGEKSRGIFPSLGGAERWAGASNPWTPFQTHKFGHCVGLSMLFCADLEQYLARRVWIRNSRSKRLESWLIATKLEFRQYGICPFMSNLGSGRPFSDDMFPPSFQLLAVIRWWAKRTNHRNCYIRYKGWQNFRSTAPGYRLPGRQKLGPHGSW